MSNARRAVATFLLKVLVTVACLWWLARYFDFVQVRNSLANVNPLLVLFAIVLHLLSWLAGGVRWWLLFRHLAEGITFRQVWPSYYLGVFFNNLLPSAYGGDLARTARLYVSGLSGSALVGSALADRFLGLIAVVFMGSVALLLAPPDYANRLALTVIGAGLLVILPVVIVFIVPDWARLLDSGYAKRWPRLHAVLACIPHYRRAPGLLFKAFVLSVINQLLVVVVLLVLAPEVGIHIPVFQFVVVLTLVFLVTSLPISLGGLGPREGAMMSLLLPLGADATAVLTLSMVYLLVLWSSTLPGAFMLLLRQPTANNATGPPAVNNAN